MIAAMERSLAQALPARCKPPEVPVRFLRPVSGSVRRRAATFIADMYCEPPDFLRARGIHGDGGDRRGWREDTVTLQQQMRGLRRAAVAWERGGIRRRQDGVATSPWKLGHPSSFAPGRRSRVMALSGASPVPHRRRRRCPRLQCVHRRDRSSRITAYLRAPSSPGAAKSTRRSQFSAPMLAPPVSAVCRTCWPVRSGWRSLSHRRRTSNRPSGLPPGPADEVLSSVVNEPDQHLLGDIARH